MEIQPKSGILYEGPSKLDPSREIIVVATYSNRNPKTGHMVQTYILDKASDPMRASRDGSDAAICGDCALRGKADPNKAKGVANGRQCYVTLFHGPLVVWKAFHNGVYKNFKNDPFGIVGIGRGRMVRLGTYGDPAAVPARVWKALTLESNGWTGYTHQWRNNTELQGLCMASVETAADAQKAAAAGWRYFRVLMGTDTGSDVTCPASKEAGRRSTCEKCLLCMGTSSKSPKNIMIRKH